MSTSRYSQNVSGSDGFVGFFFGAFAAEDGLLTMVQVGWFAQGPGVSNGVVVAIDPTYDHQTVTIEGTQQFQSGRSYVFTSYRTGGVACFVEGTRIATKGGYKPVETLSSGTDLVVTSDGRLVPFELVSATIPCADQETAPYLIEPHAFGRNVPSHPLRISGTHKILAGKRRGVWTCAKVAAHSNPLVTQYGIGDPVTYHHIECDDYLADNLIAEGAVCESFGTATSTRGVRQVYTWNEKLGGFTRIGRGSLP